MPASLPSAQLKKLVKLSERKEALMAEIQEIDRHMLRLEREFRQTPANPAPEGRLTFSVTRKKTRGRRTRSSLRRKTGGSRRRKS